MRNDTVIQAVRGFNRFYTQRIGALSEHYLDGPYSLPELRILHELGYHPGITATVLAERLSMDHGFLSRKLKELEAKDLVKRTQSTVDKRQFSLTLTDRGQSELPKLEADASAHVEHMLAPVAPEKRMTLVESMGVVQRLLSQEPSPVVFRQLANGDAGWIIHRHGAVIAKEFGWNMEFEALCSQIMADFIRNYQPEWERSWIVERDGVILGSLFLVRQDAETAKLRLLYIEPAARGMGLATKLLEKSFQFARGKGYRKVTLFTTSSNVAARRIYQKLGMTLAREEPLDFAGESLNGEHWELTLA